MFRPFCSDGDVNVTPEIIEIQSKLFKHTATSMKKRIMGRIFYI